MGRSKGFRVYGLGLPKGDWAVVIGVSSEGSARVGGKVADRDHDCVRGIELVEGEGQVEEDDDESLDELSMDSDADCSDESRSEVFATVTKIGVLRFLDDAGCWVCAEAKRSGWRGDAETSLPVEPLDDPGRWSGSTTWRSGRWGGE